MSLVLKQNPDALTILYVTLDDLVTGAPALPRRSPAGRPCILSNSELLTVLIYGTLVDHHQTLRDLYDSVLREHRWAFPAMPSYSAFVAHCHRLLPLLAWVFRQLCAPLPDEHYRFVDGTALPVCDLVRSSSHRVAKGVARHGKASTGWFFGFKLHAAVTETGSLRIALITPGNLHDRRLLERLVESFEGIAVGDAGYMIKQPDRQRLWRKGLWLLTGVRRKMAKLMTDWQYQLLKLRRGIESVFDVLKEHYHLVTSFPRSLSGYLLHYLRVLTAYQLTYLVD